MGSVSLINGKPVPCVLTASQTLVLFPQGLAGLHECFGKQSYVFPDAEGTVRLKPGASYVLFSNGAMSCMNQEGSEGYKHETPEWAPNINSFSSSFPMLRTPIGKLTPEMVSDEQCLFRLPDAPSFYTDQNAREAMRSCSPHKVQSYALSGDISNYLMDSVSADNEVERPNTEYTGDLYLCSQFRFSEGPGKLIQDRVYEYIFLPMVAFRIIDTLEFQRLRSLKQLGTTVFLYPGATHTRFEHSIGVAHLASEMIRHIALWQPELGITRADIVCVIIAGLCHDIGHGPFSHLFECVVNRIREGKPGHRPWHHEQMSVRLLRRVLSRLHLADYDLTDEDAHFIELCIAGLSPRSPWPTNIGRPPHKRFILDIVANKRNGLDVDKLDYFLRDSLGCYGRAALDVHIPRLLSACRVLCYEDEYQICFEEKMALSLGDIFNVRAKLHKHAYQHRVAKVTDYMVSDALYEADPFFRVRGTNGQLIRISDCVEDEEGFCQLGDWVLNAIAASADPRLAKAQSIIQRINERDFYSVVGTAMFSRYQVRITEQRIQEDILSYCLTGLDDLKLREAIERTLIVSFITITFGSKDEQGAPDDPINHVVFYNPKNMELGAFKLPGDRISPIFSPSEYGERFVIVMVRDRAFLDIVTHALDTWRERNERYLGVAVPTSNRRKDESPGKSSAMTKRQSENIFNLNIVEPSADVVPFSEIEQLARCGSTREEAEVKPEEISQPHGRREVTKSVRSSHEKQDDLQGQKHYEGDERKKKICRSEL